MQNRTRPAFLPLTGAAALLLAAAAHAQNPPIRIMPLGDSITYGSPVLGGYRAPLYHMLTNAAYNVDYVGSGNGNASADLPEINHEGHGGWRISDATVGLYENLYGWFEAIEDPHVVLLHIGTNDSGGGTAFTNAYVRLEALIDRIVQCQPSAKIIVTSLMKRGEPNYAAITNVFNPYVPLVVAHQQALGHHVTFLDMHACLELSDMGDNLHPNAAGYAKMANAWFPAITNIIGTNTVANQPALIRAAGNNNQTNVTITFNKAVSPASATNLANYAANKGLAILGASLSANRRTVTLATGLQAGGTNYTVTASNVKDETAPAPLSIPAASQVSFTAYKPPVPRGYANYVPESAYYALVYSLDLATTPNYSTGVPYSVDNSALVGGFDRVAYYLELQKSGEDLQYVWVSMDAFTNRADKLGIPTFASGELYQRYVQNLSVVCNVPGVTTGQVASGNIEFWPWNYSAGNTLGVPGANISSYDFGDQCSFSANYSCMQVHNYAAGQTLFALNHWNSGGTLEAGIGNCPTPISGGIDWTFNGNGGAYTVKTLHVLVRRDTSDTTPPAPLSAQADATRQFITVIFSEPLTSSSADCAFFALDSGVQVLGATLLADQRSVTLNTTPQPAGTPLTLSVSGVRDSSPSANAVPPGTAIAVAAPGLPSEIVSNVGTNAGDLAAGYELVYTLDIPVTGKFNATPDPYRVNRGALSDPFDRIAYYAELQKTDGTTQYLWTSMSAFTPDRKKIGVPTLATGALFQQSVSSLDVKSNVPGVTNGTGLAGGNLEFWPTDYAATNALSVTAASNTTLDFGDSRTATGAHGSMQIHNSAAKQTLFAMNNWGADGQLIALGIGNRPTADPDWTFAANAGTDYARRTLHVLALPPAPPALPPQVAANVPDAVGYRHVYTIDLPVNGSFFTAAPTYCPYTNTAGLTAFSRVAYYLELQSGSNPTQYIWTAMDAFTADVTKLGVPVTNTFFQTRVTRLDVRSNVGGIVTGSDFDTGNIEFWPSNYGGNNALPIPNAHNVNFDFGDGGASATANGYGSMQVHNYGAGVTQTLFAVNNFNNNQHLCVGIGNCTNPVFQTPAYGVDWTFKSNASTYNHRRLYVFVLCKGSTGDLTRPALLNATGSLALNQIAVSFNEPLSENAATPSFFTVSSGVSVTGARLSLNKRDVILTTSPMTAGQTYTVTVTGARDRSPSANPVAPGSSASFTAPAPKAAGVLANVPEAAAYELISFLAVSNTTSYANGASYLFDESKFQRAQPFDRVAYCMELVTNGVAQWVWVSMDAFTNDLSMIGVPTADRADPWLQTYVSNMNVYASANVANVTVTTGVGIASGNIEFWSSSYGAGNTRNIPGASGSNYDFGDDRGSNRGAGHGSMQVNNFAQGHTIFSMVHFGSNSSTPGLGIGNRPGVVSDPDWTFTYNAALYSTKNLFILARPGAPAGTTGSRPDLWNQPRSTAVRAGAHALLSVYAPAATAYQWRKNGVGIPGATRSWLEIAPASLSDSGSYDVLVFGSGSAYTLSQSAMLTVMPSRGMVFQLR